MLRNEGMMRWRLTRTGYVRADRIGSLQQVPTCISLTNSTWDLSCIGDIVWQGYVLGWGQTVGISNYANAHPVAHPMTFPLSVYILADGKNVMTFSDLQSGKKYNRVFQCVRRDLNPVAFIHWAEDTPLWHHTVSCHVFVATPHMCCLAISLKDRFVVLRDSSPGYGGFFEVVVLWGSSPRSGRLLESCVSPLPISVSNVVILQYAYHVLVFETFPSLADESVHPDGNVLGGGPTTSWANQLLLAGKSERKHLFPRQIAYWQKREKAVIPGIEGTQQLRSQADGPHLSCLRQRVSVIHMPILSSVGSWWYGALKAIKAGVCEVPGLSFSHQPCQCHSHANLVNVEEWRCDALKADWAGLCKGHPDWLSATSSHPQNFVLYFILRMEVPCCCQTSATRSHPENNNRCSSMWIIIAKGWHGLEGLCSGLGTNSGFKN